MIPVRGSKSENRWSQTKHEIFQPLPIKQLTVSPSGFGKTTVLLAAAEALFEHMDYWAIFSKSHMLDPAWKELIQKIRALYHQRGIDESEHPFLFENLEHLGKVLQTQKQQIKLSVHSQVQLSLECLSPCCILRRSCSGQNLFGH